MLNKWQRQDFCLVGSSVIFGCVLNDLSDLNFTLSGQQSQYIPDIFFSYTNEATNCSRISINHDMSSYRPCLYIINFSAGFYLPEIHTTHQAYVCKICVVKHVRRRSANGRCLEYFEFASLRIFIEAMEFAVVVHFRYQNTDCIII